MTLLRGAELSRRAVGSTEERRMFLLGAGATSGLSDASAPALLSLEAV